MVGMEKTCLYLLILIYVLLPLISLTWGKCNCTLYSAFICNTFFGQPMKAEDNFRDNKNGTILQKDLVGI